MAITNSNIYQDLIMNPDYMPNRLQNLQMFPPVDLPSSFSNEMNFSSGDELVPGMGTPAINFTDAPVENIFLRQNNPTKGFLDRNFNYRALNLGTPEATAKYLAKNNFPIPQNLEEIDTRNFVDKTKDKLGKGFNIGKQGILTALGFATKAPLGLLSLVGKMLPEMDPRQKALREFYGYDNIGRVPQGQLMAGYNPVSGGLLNALTGGKYGDETTYGLSGAIDKRIARIQKTLAKQRKDKRRKESEVLQQRLKDLQALKDREAKVLADATKQKANIPATPGFDVSGGAGGSYDQGFDYSGAGDKTASDSKRTQDRRSSDLGFSDVRLKENVELIGKSPSNINIYKFNYKDNPTTYQGAMAHEVPWASVKHSNGYMMIDYNQIDVEFKKWQK